MQQFLNDKESLDWAKEVHKVPKRARSFIIFGNEDSPESIKWFTKKNPKYNDKGILIRFNT